MCKWLHSTGIQRHKIFSQWTSEFYFWKEFWRFYNKYLYAQCILHKYKEWWHGVARNTKDIEFSTHFYYSRENLNLLTPKCYNGSRFAKSAQKRNRDFECPIIIFWSRKKNFLKNNVFWYHKKVTIFHFFGTQ